MALDNAGFQVFGDHGGVQIDQNFMNYSLLQKGDITVVTSELNSYTTVSVNAVAPIFCIRNTSGNYVAVAYLTRSGSTFTWRLSANGSATAITYYIFDQIPNNQAAVGLTVFDASGRVTFSSDYDPMRIVAANQVGNSSTTWDANWATGWPQSWGAPYGGTFAVAVSSPRLIQVGMGGTGYSYLYTDGVRCDSGAYYVDKVLINRIPIVTNATQQPYGGQAFLVDVGRL